MPTLFSNASCCDGYEWILEKHTKEGYQVVNRWPPNEKRHLEF